MDTDTPLSCVVMSQVQVTSCHFFCERLMLQSHLFSELLLFFPLFLVLFT